MIVELSPVYVGFSNFGGDVFKGLQMGGGTKCFVGQFVFDVAAVTCVIYNCPLMRDRAIHQWILFIAPTQGRRRRLTCDKLRRSSKW